MPERQLSRPALVLAGMLIVYSDLDTPKHVTSGLQMSQTTYNFEHTLLSCLPNFLLPLQYQHSSKVHRTTYCYK